uniref:Uncharacterized protein n=1 Tax=Anguilla anguilla TaxID=7936 RepID=A0A0E9VJY6_ANGAN
MGQTFLTQTCNQSLKRGAAEYLNL